MFKIGINLNSFKKESEHIQKAMRTAAQRTVRKLAVTARAKMVQDITHEYNLKSGDLKKKIIIQDRTNSEIPSARIVPEKRYDDRGGKTVGISLTLFGAKETNEGVKVRVKKSGGYKPIKHAFFATLESGHKAILWRKNRPPTSSIPASRRKFPLGVKTKRAGVLPGMYRGLPKQIKALTGPSLPAMFSGRGRRIERILWDANRNAQKTFEHEIEWALKN